jgi:hypothetical protein
MPLRMKHHEPIGQDLSVDLKGVGRRARHRKGKAENQKAQSPF